MNGRENMLQALRRQHPAYIPHAYTFCDSQLKTLKEKTGSDDMPEFFELDYRYIKLNPTKLQHQYDDYFPDKSILDSINEWGVGWKKKTIAHLSGMVHPMKNFQTTQEIQSFPLPDMLADYRWEGVEERIKACKKEGFLTVYYAVQIFEYAWYLRGMEELLTDMFDEDEKALLCIERIANLQEKLCERFAGAGIDMIVYGDDVGTQKGLMMSKPMWVTQLKPSLKRCISAAKKINPEMLVFYHSDGWIESLIEDLIEIGVDVLNPVQPECMNPKEIKDKYGDRLSFWGTIGTQTTMPFGSPNDVREVVRDIMETVGKGGGLVVAPTHVLEPEVPWENIIAFQETVMAYRNY